MEVGRDQLVLGGAHLDLFQTARALNGLAIDRPGRYRVNNARASYTWRSGRLSVAPGLSLSDTTYDDVFVGGRRVVQRYRDRLATEGNVTTRWQLAPLRDLVLDLRAVDFSHAQREPGQPSRDATAFAVLAGIDYATDAVWRVRALAGVQHRIFADPTLRPVTGPMAEASAIWSPSGLTTVTATLSRRTEDAASSPPSPTPSPAGAWRWTTSCSATCCSQPPPTCSAPTPSSAAGTRHCSASASAPPG